MLAVPLLLTSTIDFHISVRSIGGNPVAEHENMKPGNARTIGAGSSSITLGEATERNNSLIFIFFVK